MLKHNYYLLQYVLVTIKIMNKYLLLHVVLGLFSYYAYCLDCEKLSGGSCGCAVASKHQMIDLTPMTKLSNAPMFTNIEQNGVLVSTLYTDMCRRFTCDSPNTAYVCMATTQILNITIGHDVSFKYAEASDLVTVIYSKGDSSTHITLHCSEGMSGLGTLSFTPNPPASTIFATLTSHYACWTKTPKTGLSIGSILCIVLLVLIVVYIVGGILINKYVRKVEGKNELFPNQNMWKNFPSLVKDGALFTVRKIRRKDDEYQSI